MRKYMNFKNKSNSAEYFNCGIKVMNNIDNWMNADAALYQGKFLILDEVSLHRRGIRGKYSSH